MTDPNDTLLKEIFKAIPAHHKLAFLRETLTSLDPELRRKLLQSLPSATVTQRSPPPKRRTGLPNQPSATPPPNPRATPAMPLQPKTGAIGYTGTPKPPQTPPYQRPALHRPEYQDQRTNSTASSANRPQNRPPVPASATTDAAVNHLGHAVVTSQNELDQLAQRTQDQKDAQVQAILKQFEQQKLTILAEDQTNIKKELFLLLVWVVVGLSLLVGLSVGAGKLWHFLFP